MGHGSGGSILFQGSRRKISTRLPKTLSLSDNLLHDFSCLSVGGIISRKLYLG